MRRQRQAGEIEQGKVQGRGDNWTISIEEAEAVTGRWEGLSKARSRAEETKKHLREAAAAEHIAE